MPALRLSYAELAARLGRSTDAVRVLARRRGWQRIAGNDGRVVVLVDEGELGSDSPPGRSPERSPDQSDNVTLIADLRERIGRLEGEAAGQAALIDELRAQLAWHRQPWWSRLW